VQNFILIIAGSARMLAQAARLQGLNPLAIDMFADVDTQSYAVDFWRVADLSTAQLMPAVAFFTAHYPVTQVVYGSGFEHHPESLMTLNQRLVLTGNTPAVFANTLNKKNFFAVLDALAIPYPPTVFAAPTDTCDWLTKPLRGQGGAGIRRYQPAQADAAVYWQKFQAGAPHSVLFLANGQTVQIIGFNRQWAVNLGDGAEFMFAGVVNQTDLSHKQQTIISGWLRKLVPALGLRGLNSLDFMQDGERNGVLEINPRPSASMQLYNGGLLLRHIKACAGQLLATPLPEQPVRAYQVVYAPEAVCIPKAMNWPDGCMDLPQSGVICRTGEPICSMIASHKTVSEACRQLESQRRALFDQLLPNPI
jgi:methenyltetrahydromethanopterin cyclohydrolase